MAKLNKKQLVAELKKLGVEVDPAKELTNLQLEKLLVKAKVKKLKDSQDDDPDKLEPEPERLQPKEPAEDKAPMAESVKGDYLQQYQYKKETPLGHITTNPSPGSKPHRMKQQLLKQPRVRIIVPRPPGEPDSIRLSVCLNRYRLDLPKQSYIEVPEQVALVIMRSQKQTDEALKPFRLDGSADQARKDALNI